MILILIEHGKGQVTENNTYLYLVVLILWKYVCIQIVGWHAVEGANCRRDQSYVREHAGRAASGATVCRREPPATRSSAPAIIP